MLLPSLPIVIFGLHPSSYVGLAVNRAPKAPLGTSLGSVVKC